ncbi:MAG: TetR/AcrR family transcriptional regulator [Actinomycetota bacterium]|nr:TetR/AcrR family transcriptional regulator [Actinomycetota bacterium]
MTSTSHRSTRETILDAGVRLFTERGSGVRLEDIADEAGVSRQTLYVHFGSRAGLLLGLVQQVDASGMLERLVQQVVHAPSSAETLDAVAHLHAEYSPVAYPIARLFMSGRHEDDALRVAWDDRMEARRNLYREVVRRLSSDGVLASEWTVKSAVEVMFALTSWQLWEQLVVDQNWTKAEYRDRLGRMLRRVLLK